MSENTTNRAVEDAAVAFVLSYERHQGRSAADTRGTGAPADVQSDRRLIEIKAYGRSARGQDLWLEPRQIEEARANPDFRVYIVENVRQGDPDLFQLIVLAGEQLQRLIERSRERRYFVVPFPTGEYDDALLEAGESRLGRGSSFGSSSVADNVLEGGPEAR
jgi:hypothetical protein